MHAVAQWSASCMRSKGGHFERVLRNLIVLSI
jgi:hypothetical protein